MASTPLPLPEVEERVVTPAEYFDYVKGMKEKLKDEDCKRVIDTVLSMMKKCTITGQTEMAKRLAHQAKLAMRQSEAVKAGYDIFVNRKDVEKFADSVSDSSVKITELKDFEREIPDDIVEKVQDAQKYFDKMYIIFTDYTLKDTKKVAKERREKDPVIFGAFLDLDCDTDSKIYIEDRMFFIADWTDELCDLTLEEIVTLEKSNSGNDITYKVDIPTSEEEIRKYLDSFSKPIEENKSSNIFDGVSKIVKSVTKKRKQSAKRGGKKKE